MPIIKSAIKRMKQDNVRRTRNKHYGNRMKSLIKLFLGYVSSGEAKKAEKALSEVISAIDTAAKKNIIHENNAARKKSRVQRALKNVPEKKAEVKKGSKKVEKKVEAKVEKAEEAPKKEVEKKDDK